MELHVSKNCSKLVSFENFSYIHVYVYEFKASKKHPFGVGATREY